VSDSRSPVLAYIYDVSATPTWDSTVQYTYLYQP
jgi:hypothetical protein